MLLVAGGQLDPNIGALLRRILEREIPFVDVIVGPDSLPRIDFDLANGDLHLDGNKIAASACFVRHNVFYQPQRHGDSEADLNWYQTIRGWALSNPDVKMFNQHSIGAESNKIYNLFLAKQCGLTIPRTFITNHLERPSRDFLGPAIAKPVAGGQLTRTLEDAVVSEDGDNKFKHPQFVQRKLLRPEVRVYMVESTPIAFTIDSPDLDYRENNNVAIAMTSIPELVTQCLSLLASKLNLNWSATDFMRDPDSGELIFLEINSQPMFARFDMVANGLISDLIIDALLISK